MNKMIFLVTLCTASAFSNAGELVRDTIIAEVSNTSSGGPDFSLRIEGGLGPCADQLIKFPESKKASDESNGQAFSIALAAFATGKKVRIHNFEDDDCFGASFIAITN